jgi:hypothetical protein
MVRIVHLTNSGLDGRGDSFTMPEDVLEFIGKIKDIHLASIVPSAVRGDHFHLRRREVLIISYSSPWAFYWDEGPEPSHHAEWFNGAGTAAIMVEPGCSHAVENTGTLALWMCALSSESYDPLDSVRRVVSGGRKSNDNKRDIPDVLPH